MNTIKFSSDLLKRLIIVIWLNLYCRNDSRQSGHRSAGALNTLTTFTWKSLWSEVGRQCGRKWKKRAAYMPVRPLFTTFNFLWPWVNNKRQHKHCSCHKDFSFLTIRGASVRAVAVDIVIVRTFQSRAKEHKLLLNLFHDKHVLRLAFSPFHTAQIPIHCEHGSARRHVEQNKTNISIVTEYFDQILFVEFIRVDLFCNWIARALRQTLGIHSLFPFNYCCCWFCFHWYYLLQ